MCRRLLCNCSAVNCTPFAISNRYRMVALPGNPGIPQKDWVSGINVSSQGLVKGIGLFF